MKDFSMLFPGRVYVGNNSLEKLSSIQIKGSRGLIITGRNFAKKSGLLDRVKKIVRKQSKEVFVFDGVEPEVSVETVDRACDLARRYRADFFIGLGGGSALDCAKAVSGIYRDHLGVKDYLDKKIPVRKDTGYLIAIPTTAGSGSEATKNAVLYYTEKRIKISLRGDSLVPSAVIIDPELTLSLPKQTTAYSGMDALTHAVESLFSRNANELTEILSMKAMTLIVDGLPKAYKNGSDGKSRYNVMLGSFTAGLAFANAGLGAAHGIGHPLGAVLNIPHGLVNAVLLPHVIEYNMSACSAQLEQIKKVTGMDLLKKIRSMNRAFGIPARISAILPRAGEKLQEILDRMDYSASMSYNPVAMDEAGVKKLLKEAL
jgi:1,3-propanediol dehydrogenase/alcohol dehydrogenase